MEIGGHSLKEHFRLLLPLFGFVFAVWALRLVLDAAGVSHKIASASSVTVASTLAILLAVLLIHFRGFGSYYNVVTAVVMLVVWSQLLVILAIVFSVATGKANIFTAPEFSVPGDDPHHLKHILGHLTFGIGVQSLFGAGVGCLLLLVLRMMLPLRSTK